MGNFLKQMRVGQINNDNNDNNNNKTNKKETTRKKKSPLFVSQAFEI